MEMNGKKIEYRGGLNEECYFLYWQIHVVVQWLRALLRHATEEIKFEVQSAVFSP